MAMRAAPESKGVVEPFRLSRYVVLTRVRGLFIFLCVLVGVALALLDISRTKKAYVSSAQVFVTTSDVSNVSDLFSGNQFAVSRVQSYISVVTTPSITGPVRQRLGLDLTDRQLSQKISGDAPLNKTLVNIHVRDGSADRATQIANAVAAQFIVTVKDIETNKAATATATATSVLKLTVIHPALVPTTPVAPQKTLTLLVGFFGGLAVGLFVVVFRERIYNRLRSPRDVEATSASPLLGVIPADRRAKSKPNAFQFDNASPRTEAFRQLRTNLQFVDVDDPPKVIAITSPVGREGKTAVALNLAVSLSEAGLSVGLIETDLRQPVLARLLDLDGEIGLTSLLIGSARIEEAIQRVQGGLSVVTSGRLPPNPSELLASAQLRAVIAALAKRFDYVILDAASLLPVADGAEVVAAADATVLVVRAAETNRENFRRSVNAVTRVGGTIAGVVLNRSSDVSRVARGRGSVAPYTKTNGKVDARSAEGTTAERATEATSRTGARHVGGNTDAG